MKHEFSKEEIGCAHAEETACAQAERHLRELFSTLAASCSVSNSPLATTVAGLMGSSVSAEEAKIKAECTIRALVTILSKIGDESEVDVELTSALSNIGVMSGELELSQEAREELRSIRRWTLEY